MTHDSDTYDIIIIGAGIQGAGVAQAAAISGYKTLVLEKFPAAGLGTSCKSSKLIHGGLRYLETGQLKLVRECLQERKRLLKNVPHLVKLISFYIPIYNNSTRPAWLIWLGLCIYSIFSFKKFSIVKKSQWKNLDNLCLDNLRYVFKYYDAQTDDMALTQAVIKSAIKQGAEVRYNAELINCVANKKNHNVCFKENSRLLHVHGKCIINCSGPWVKTTQNNISPELHLPEVDLISGTHIVINHAPVQGAYYIQANDNRAIFILPWKNNTALIGTTETPYSGDPGEVTPSDSEIAYLLENYNLNFNAHVTKDEIISAFSGVRVLPGNKKSSFKKSRDSLIIHNSDMPAQITIVGGKLTGYRASSEKVITLLKKILPLNSKIPASRTRDLKL